TMVALEKADVSFRFMMQVRNKVLEAYQEIIRMQV
ncbi:MAG: flagellar hook-basal body complex protein FliE, partial [Gammaproteobacteria bacterium]